LSPTPAEVGILVGIAALILTGWVAIAFAAGWRPLRRRRTVLVTLRTGETLRGVLVARHPTFLELARVEVLRGDGASSTVDGTLQVDRDNVTWVQVP
jgi:small nuclear ribonucleoprotein (snRNP)-like protein